MAVKITVLTRTDRMGYIDTMVKSLWEQTFNDFEWVLVDDLFDKRKALVRAYVNSSIKIKHIPPKIISPYPAPGSADNTGLSCAEGELVYFMADRIYPHPDCLARHWEIYQKYGPKVFTSGPFIDDMAFKGIAILWNDSHMPETIFIPEGKLIDSDGILKEEISIDFSRGLPLKIKESPDFISNLVEPFNPQWPSQRVPDYRLADIKNTHLIDKDLLEGYHPSWWWAGRNDSMPLEALLEANGFNESFDGWRGGHDGEMSNRVFAMGYRYLMDISAPCFVLPGMPWKKEKGPVEERDKNIRPNPFNLREIRRQALLMVTNLKEKANDRRR